MGGVVVQPPDIFPPCGIKFNIVFILFSPPLPGGEKTARQPPDIRRLLSASPTGTEGATQKPVSPLIHSYYYDYYILINTIDTESITSQKRIALTGY